MSVASNGSASRGDFEFGPDFMQSQREALEAAFGNREEVSRG